MASNVWHCLGKTMSIFLFIIIVIPMVLVVLSIGFIIMALLLPPSLTLYCMTHSAQISRNCRANSKKMAEFRGGLANFICHCFVGVASISLIWLSIWMLIFFFSPGLQHRNFYDQPIWKWAQVLEDICLFGICIMEVGAGRLGFRNFSVDSCGSILAVVLAVITRSCYLKEPTILGLQMGEWLLVILLVLLTHNAISILTSSAAAWLRIHYQRNNDPSGGSPSQKRQPWDIDDDLVAAIGVILSYLLPSKETWEWTRLHVVYFAQGLSRSTNFILTSLLFLLTWILYFGSRLNRTSASIREAYDYVTWTLICVFIISICWLVKDAIVLYWASRVVYDRFHVEISQRSTQLWLLGILGGREFDILGIDWNDRHEGLDQDKSEIKENLQRDHNGQEGEDQRDNEDTQEGDGKDHCEIDMMDEKSEDEHSSKDDNNGQEPKTPTNCRPMVNNNHEAQGEVIRLLQLFKNALIGSTIGQRLRPDEEARQVLVPSAGQKDRLPIHNIEGMAAYFLAAEGSLSKKSYVSDFCKKWDLINGRSNIHENKPPIMDLDEKEIEGETVKVLRSDAFDNWIKKAHKSSLDLARSLSGAKEGVDSLNQIIAWLIIGVAIVIWLPVTGMATLQEIVLIASLVLTAASFTFGDTCKTFYQGFMFAYVRHPLTVGDRCTINDSTEIMRVMRIGLWDTIFYKTSSKVEVIYLNSVLASSAINKLKGIDPDHDDEENERPSHRRSKSKAKKRKIKTPISKKTKSKRTSLTSTSHCTRPIHAKLKMLKAYADTMKNCDVIAIPLDKELANHEYGAEIDKLCIDIVYEKTEVDISVMSVFIKVLFEAARSMKRADIGFLCPHRIRGGSGLTDYIADCMVRYPRKAFFGPYFKEHHWMLFVFIPSTSTAYWLNSIEREIPSTIKEVFEVTMKLYHERSGENDCDGANHWVVVKQCPKQDNGVDCGYYVMRFMKEIMDNTLDIPQNMPDEYYEAYRDRAYNDAEIEEVRVMWAKKVLKYVVDRD